MIRSKITNLRKEKEELEREYDHLKSERTMTLWFMGSWSIATGDLERIESKMRRKSASIDETSNQLTAQVKARESIERSIWDERLVIRGQKEVITWMELRIQGRVLSFNHPDHSRYPCYDIIKPF